MRYLFLLLLFITTDAFAVLPAPPVLKNTDYQIPQYMKSLYDNHNVIEVSTVIPNGNVKGNTNQIVIYNYATGPSLWVNIGGTAWRQLI